MANKAAYRYANATYELADEAKVLNSMFSDMKALKATLVNSPELKNLLKNPVINLKKKAEIAQAVFKDTNELTKKLLQLLADKNRMHQVDQVADAFIALYEKAHDIQRATVVSATALDQSTEKDIRKKIKELTGSEVELRKETDVSLIGGFLLKINDKQYDASVAGQFKRIRQNLVTQN
ncbi:MAG: ATP synthase F1 subunit delta [Psychroflexus sp.]|nr:ATP synthase F1 subunit delta [Psychroflexus sp.]MDR9449244.1 ATP synthase F1 subunit delta [Psychroflexus sp.]